MTYDHEFSDIREETEETTLREEGKTLSTNSKRVLSRTLMVCSQKELLSIVQSIQKEQIKHLYVRQSMTLKKYLIRVNTMKTPYQEWTEEVLNTSLRLSSNQEPKSLSTPEQLNMVRQSFAHIVIRSCHSISFQLVGT